MDPARGEDFLKNIAKDADFRKAFSGYYMSMAATMVLLKAPEPNALLFLLEKIEKVKLALEEEQKWLAASRHKVEARERRVDTLDQG